MSSLPVSASNDLCAVWWVWATADLAWDDVDRERVRGRCSPLCRWVRDWPVLLTGVWCGCVWSLITQAVQQYAMPEYRQGRPTGWAEWCHRHHRRRSGRAPRAQDGRGTAL